MIHSVLYELILIITWCQKCSPNKLFVGDDENGIRIAAKSYCGGGECVCVASCCG